MVMSVIIGPAQQPASSTGNKPQPLPPLCQRLGEHCTELIDYRLLYRLRHQTEPEHIWSLISKVVALEKPRSSRQRDQWRLFAYERLKMMMRVGIAERVQRHYVRVGPLIPEWQRDVGSARLRPVGRRPSRRKEMRKAPRTGPYSQVPMFENRKRIEPPPAPDNHPARREPDAAVAPTPSVSPYPRAEAALDIGLAAKRLAAHRWELSHRFILPLHGQRVRAHQAVLLPDGTEARLVASLKGTVVVCVGDVLRLDENEILRRREHELRLIKNSSAVVLGRRKLGRREGHSERKAMVCRRNGGSPVRTGSRPRGRPRGKSQADFKPLVSAG
jgi:hypothetical protein